ncbi:MAG: threonine/serine dehydratase [Woeseia sp.]
MITLQTVEAAANRLQGIAVRTPLLECPALDELCGGSVLLKPECLQRTGSFKIRGAYNMLSQLNAEQRARGAVAFSSGNHAQGVAAAGTMLGIHTAIVMPEDAPQTKIENTRKLGGETILYDRYTGDREQIARRIAAERGAVLVPSYDHEDIIAGQGTVGLEIMQQCGDEPPDQVIVCCGGGGLIAGCATAIRGISPATAVYAVEPEHFDDTARSLAAGERVANDPNARGICDALQTPTPGKLTFEINQQLLAGVLVVSEDAVREAMRFACQELKLVVEPGGAVALAAVLSGLVECAERRTVVVLSGGNVEARLFAEIQRGAAPG